MIHSRTICSKERNRSRTNESFENQINQKPGLRRLVLNQQVIREQPNLSSFKTVQEDSFLPSLPFPENCDPNQENLSKTDQNVFKKQTKLHKN